MPHLPESRVSTQIICNSSAWEIDLFSLIYFFDYLFIPVQIYGYLFYTLSYNTTILYFFSCSNFSSFHYWELFHLAVLFFCVLSPHHCGVFEHFLTFWRYKGLLDDPVHFLPQFLNPPFLQGYLVFLLENGIRNQNFGQRDAYCQGMSLLLSSFN